MSVDRASTITALVLLPGVFASPLAGFLSDHYFRGKRKPLILIGNVHPGGIDLSFIPGGEYHPWQQVCWPSSD